MSHRSDDHKTARGGKHSIHLGESVGIERGALPKLHADGPLMRTVAGRLWMRALVARQLKSPYHKRYQAVRDASVPDSALGHHAAIVGKTGSGKTRLGLRLIAEQLRLGRSLVMLDPKTGTVDYALDAARKAGVPPDRVTVVTPGDLSAGVPGWNPLGAGMPVHLAAAELVSILSSLYGSAWGPRLGDILTSALTVLAAKRLSIFELQAFLTSDAYRANVLDERPGGLSAEDAVAYRVAEDSFRREFDLWTKADKTAAVNPVLNKTRGLMRSAFFQYFLCARENSFDFADLWRRQEVVLVHIDDSVLGSDGSSLLSGMVARCLHNTAMRVGHPGANPVVLCVDEMGVQNPFLTDSLAKILAVAREKNLRLMAVCQFLGQVSPNLRQALLTQSMVQAFFMLGDGDAEIVAGALAAEEEDYVADATVREESVDRDTGLPNLVKWSQPVLDGSGNGIDVDPAMWERMRRRDLFAPLAKGPFVRPSPIDDLRRMAAASGIPRLYVICPDTGQPIELGRYLDGVSDVDFGFQGPREVTLEITVPRPKVTNVGKASAAERTRIWARELRKLPGRQAVFRIRDGKSSPLRIRVADVPDMAQVETDRAQAYGREALRLRGRSVDEADQEMRDRVAAIDDYLKLPQPATAPVNPASEPAAKPDKVAKSVQALDAQNTEATSQEVPSVPLNDHATPNQSRQRPPRRIAPQTVGRIAGDGSMS
jgi:hypothetical protein